MPMFVPVFNFLKNISGTLWAVIVRTILHGANVF